MLDLKSIGARNDLGTQVHRPFAESARRKDRHRTMPNC
jgi:hypothetical protein